MLEKMNFRKKTGIVLTAITMTISTLTLFSGILLYATMNGESNGVLQTSSTGNKNNVIVKNVKVE